MQERSQETVARILDGASRVLGELPLADVTTSLIAQAAGVSVGALYRFFPDKQAIVDAIAVRHVEAFQRELEQLLLSGNLRNPQQFFGAVIDCYVGFLETRPDFRAIAFGRHISQHIRQSQTEPDAAGTGVVKRFMTEMMGMPASRELDLRLKIAIETGERLIAFAYEQPTPESRRQVIEEMKRLLAGYLFGA